jgi:integrase
VIKADPIKTLKDVKAIKRQLGNCPRDLALFTCGISWFLRAGDLLSIRVGQVRGLRAGESFVLREEKCGKVREIVVGHNVHQVLQDLLKSMGDGVCDSDFLFQSRKGQKNKLTVPTLSSMVKGWCKDINLSGHYSSHSLRKTGGFLNRTLFNVDVATLMKVYGHSTQQMTMKYICVQEEEVKSCYLREL